MTLSEFRFATGTRHRGYSAGYDAGYLAATSGEPFRRPNDDSPSWADGWLDGFEDGSAITAGRPFDTLTFTEGLKP